MDVKSLKFESDSDRENRLMKIGELVIRAYSHYPLTIGMVLSEAEDEEMGYISYEIMWADGSCTNELDVELDNAEWILNALKREENK